jgi:TonB family protein
MGYQALLFCPDEKLARVVSHVFGDLDFTVDPVHEPFAAVKKLMAQRYDAIVVDCENEQNASLLFKSARNSSSNQSSLAIALVEGQAGVAKAYRIGANLVLTKPINIEQAKGTLRVARGLLRKNSDAAGAGPASLPANVHASAGPAKPAFASAPPQSTIRNVVAAAPRPQASDDPEFTIPQAPAISHALPAMAASAEGEEHSAAVNATEVLQSDFADAVEDAITAISTPAPSGSTQSPGSVFVSSSGSGAAPAPAKESSPSGNGAEIASPAIIGKAIVGTVPAGNTVDQNSVAPHTVAETSEAAAIELEPTRPSHDHNAVHDEVVSAPLVSSVSASDVPSFGGLSDEDSGGSGSTKKMLVAAVVVLALAAAGYFGFAKHEQPNASPVPQPASSQAPPVATPASSQLASPATSKPDSGTSATLPASTKSGPTSVVTGANPTIRIATNPPQTSAAAGSQSVEPEALQTASAPILVKSGAGSKAQPAADESAPALPSALAAASSNDKNLSSLMPSSASRPSLATVKISQGVSQGLVIKRVQPQYPQAALAVRAQGAVQIEATISKDGAVTNVKVLSGDPVLARAALEAVRQWRYKPYYLDGQPVEIQTQITVNFKAN